MIYLYSNFRDRTSSTTSQPTSKMFDPLPFLALIKSMKAKTNGQREERTNYN